MSQHVDWLAISPPLCLVVAAVVALLGDAFAPSTRRWLPTTVSLTAVATALRRAPASPISTGMRPYSRVAPTRLTEMTARPTGVRT